VSLDKKQDPISKITRAKKDQRWAQAVEHLPKKCKALSLNPNSTKKKKLQLGFGYAAKVVTP
jgi:hypothetical protein